jgi:hypothetical protein
MILRVYHSLGKSCKMFATATKYDKYLTEENTDLNANMRMWEKKYNSMLKTLKINRKERHAIYHYIRRQLDLIKDNN